MRNRGLIFLLFILLFSGVNLSAQEKMLYGDTIRKGVPFSKDPHVISFGNRYLMYYSVPPYSGESNPVKGWGIGIAESDDLIHWKRVGEITPAATYEEKGLCAPCALVRKDTVHLFYQTYGNREKDAICHAFSVDGISFERDKTNPVFRPVGKWNCGRAIDAEVVEFNNRYLLFFATRDPGFKIQMIGVAEAPLNTDFSRPHWRQAADFPVLTPEYNWEQECVEGASVIQYGNELYMFYAGAYNNKPQQIGVAKSSDGIYWKKLSEKPFLKNGKPGEWNSSESGHPHIFKNPEGRTFLFFQGNNDGGKTWYLSNMEVFWNEKGPYLKN